MTIGGIVRLALRGGALLLATAAIAWLVSAAIAALKSQLVSFGPFPVWQYALAAWGCFALAPWFVPARLRPLYAVIACWAIGVSLAAAADLLLRHWTASDAGLHRFEDAWVAARAGLELVLRYNLLVAVLTTVWVLTLQAAWSKRYLPRSLAWIGYAGRVLTVTRIIPGPRLTRLSSDPCRDSFAKPRALYLSPLRRDAA